MSITDTQINNFIAELRGFSPELERSEVPQNWSQSLLEDYSEKGALLELLITINIALLEEIRDDAPASGTGSPNTLQIPSPRNRLYMNLTPVVEDRQIYYNLTGVGATSGWQLMAQRRP